MVEQDALHTLLPQASKFSALFVLGLAREAKLHQVHGLGVASYTFRIGLGQHGLAGVGASETKLGLDVDVELQQTASHKLTANSCKATAAGGTGEQTQHAGHHTGGAGFECLAQAHLNLPTGWHLIAIPVSYTHLRAHETRHDLVCRLLLEKKKK